MPTAARSVQDSTSANKTKRRPRVLLDCDGVLADFIGGVLRVGHQISGVRRSKSSITEWDFIRNVVRTDREYVELHHRIIGSGFCASLRPISGAVDAVRLLQQFADVYVVTAPHLDSSTWVNERLQWLALHFGVPPSNVILASTKSLIDGDVFVDDHEGHVTAWQAERPAKKAILFAAPFNKDSELPRARSWAQLVQTIHKEVMQ